MAMALKRKKLTICNKAKIVKEVERNATTKSQVIL
jgi:hypothetical protein